MISGEKTIVTNKDTNFISRLRDLLSRNPVPKNSMPNAITTNPSPPVFLSNNGNGFAIYVSTIDHMSILIPDSSYTTQMPVANLFIENTPLNKLPNFNFLEPKAFPKQSNSFYKK